MSAASFALAVAAMALLALSMHRHARQAGMQVGGRTDRFARAVGWGLLVLSCAVRVVGPDWRIGAIEWIGALAPCAALVALVLTYRPTILPRLIVPALLVAIVAASS